MNYSFTLNLLFLGEKGVGKTTLIKKYMENISEPPVTLATGVKIWQHVIYEGDNLIKVRMWDVIDSKAVYSKNTVLLHYVDAVILVFDGTNRGSFSRIQDWNTHLQDYVKPGSLTFIVGTKYDKSDCLVSSGEVLELSDSLNVQAFVTSGHTGFWSKDTFTTIINSLKIKKYQKYDCCKLNLTVEQGFQGNLVSTHIEQVQSHASNSYQCRKTKILQDNNGMLTMSGQYAGNENEIPSSIFHNSGNNIGQYKRSFAPNNKVSELCETCASAQSTDKHADGSTRVPIPLQDPGTCEELCSTENIYMTTETSHLTDPTVFHNSAQCENKKQGRWRSLLSHSTIKQRETRQTLAALLYLKMLSTKVSSSSQENKY